MAITGVRRVRRRLGQPLTISGALIAVIALLLITLAPLLFLAFGSTLDTQGITTSGNVTFEHYRDLGADSDFYTNLTNTLKLGLSSCLGATIIGVALAWIYVYVTPPGKSFLYLLMIVPFFLSSFFTAVAWATLGNPNTGMLSTWIGKLTGIDVPLNLYSFGGLVFVLVVDTVPFVFMLSVAALRGADPSHEEAAAMSGAGRWRRQFSVVLPLASPSILAGAFFALVQALEAFAQPLVLGVPAKYSTLTTEIFLSVKTFPARYGSAGALAMVLLVLTMGLVFLQRRLLQNRSFVSFGGKSGSSVSERQMFSGPARWVVSLIPWLYVVIAVGLPYAALAITSLQPFVSSVVTNLTWDNYGFIFGDTQTVVSIRNSIVVAVVAAVIGVVWMTTIAALVRPERRLPGRGALDYVATLPIAVPGIVMGLALLWMWLRAPIPIYGTIGVMVIAYMVRFSPYMYRSIGAAMSQVDISLEESARMSGAGPVRAIRDIVVPLVRPSILSGSVIFVLFSIRDLNTTILLASTSTNLFTLRIWDLWENSRVPEVAAAAIFQTVILLVLMFVGEKLAQGGPRFRRVAGRKADKGRPEPVVTGVTAQLG